MFWPIAVPRPCHQCPSEACITVAVGLLVWNFWWFQHAVIQPVWEKKRNRQSATSRAKVSSTEKWVGDHQPRSGMCLSGNKEGNGGLVSPKAPFRKPTAYCFFQVTWVSYAGLVGNLRNPPKHKYLERTWTYLNITRFALDVLKMKSRHKLRDKKKSPGSSLSVSLLNVFLLAALSASDCPQDPRYWDAMVHAMGIQTNHKQNPDVQMDWWPSSPPPKNGWIQLILLDPHYIPYKTWQFTQLLFKWCTCHPSVVGEKCDCLLCFERVNNYRP